MSSREKILAAIAQNKPASIALPQPFVVEKGDRDNCQQLKEVIQNIGGRAEQVKDISVVESIINKRKSEGSVVVNCSALLNQPIDESLAEKKASELSEVVILIIEGTIGVAENGAVWVPEKNMINRILPFICQELVVIIGKKDIVANMHEAYERINGEQYGYGVFIAGPSKTADIEQSLVIGAHGAMELTLYILG